MYTLKLLGFAGLAVACSSASSAATVGRAVSANAADDIFTSETFTIPPFAIGGSSYDGNAQLTRWNQGMFGITSVNSNTELDSLPNIMSDASTYRADGAGIIRPTNYGERFFGVTRTQIQTQSQGLSTAEWEFDISGASDVFVSLEMAQLGTFSEANNVLPTFTYAIDGVNQGTLFTISTTNAVVFYGTQANPGQGVNSSRPLTVDGALFDHTFDTADGLFSTGSLGSGGTLTITFTAELPSAFALADAFAFRNLTVEQVPAPGAVGLLACAGLAAVRCRRG